MRVCKVCNHIYQYIATERVPTEQWHYGERIYKEKVITYCPLCNKHIRLSKDEWKKYKDYHNRYPEERERERERLIYHYNRDKKCTFTCKNALFNLDMIENPCLSVQVKDVKDVDIFYGEKL